MNFDNAGFKSGLGGFLGGLFGHSNEPYDEARKEYEKWYGKGRETQEPYYNAGKQGLSDYQNWLNNQKDPSGFINNLMNQYSESPYAHFLQQQSLNAGQNAASASGLTGSTPLMMQLQQNAGNIASQDQNQWLQNVLGINTQYGQGQNNLINAGQNSANALTNSYNNQAGHMGDAAYGSKAGKNQDWWNTLAGGLGIFGSFL